MIVVDVIKIDPQCGDALLIECGDTLFETVITELTDDGVVIQLDEGMLDKLKTLIAGGKTKIDDAIGSETLDALGYLIGIAHSQDSAGRGIDILHRALTQQQFDAFYNAVELAQRSDPIKRATALLRGMQRAQNDFANSDESDVIGLLKIAAGKLERGMQYLRSLEQNSAAPTRTITKYGELDEGWRANLGATGAAAVLGAGAALSPSAYVGGVQHYYSDAPPPANVETKTVVDDRGRKIIVWTVKKRSGEEKYYYDPHRKQTNEAEYRGRKVSLGKPFLTPDGPKKRSVYVKNPKGNVVKVNFGQKGVKIKKSNPARRKSFRARHNCANPGPRHKARYWSCKFW